METATQKAKRRKRNLKVGSCRHDLIYFNIIEARGLKKPGPSIYCQEFS